MHLTTIQKCVQRIQAYISKYGYIRLVIIKYMENMHLITMQKCHPNWSNFYFQFRFYHISYQNHILVRPNLG